MNLVIINVRLVTLLPIVSNVKMEDFPLHIVYAQMVNMIVVLLNAVTVTIDVENVLFTQNIVTNVHMTPIDIWHLIVHVLIHIMKKKI